MKRIDMLMLYLYLPLHKPVPLTEQHAERTHFLYTLHRLLILVWPQLSHKLTFLCQDDVNDSDDNDDDDDDDDDDADDDGENDIVAAADDDEAEVEEEEDGDEHNEDEVFEGGGGVG